MTEIWGRTGLRMFDVGCLLVAIGRQVGQKGSSLGCVLDEVESNLRGVRTLEEAFARLGWTAEDDDG